MSYENLVSDREKLVSDFEHFSNIHPDPLQTLFRGDRFVDICQIISKLLSTIAIQSLNMAFAIGMIGKEIKKDTDNLMIINVFCYF